MAAMPKLILTLAFVTTPFFGSGGWFNIPDPTGLDASVYNHKPAWSTPVPGPGGFPVTRAILSSQWQAQLTPAVTLPRGARAASSFFYHPRPLPQRDRNATTAYQYVWFVEDKAPSMVPNWPTAESLTERANGSGNHRLSPREHDPTLSIWPAASSFPSLHLTCFRRGA